MNQRDPGTRGYSGPPATLANHEDNGFGLIPYCRACNHRGATLTPREIAERHGLPMTAYVIDVQAKLICSKCGARESFFHIKNPWVDGSRSR